MALVSRDPFARTEIHAERDYDVHHGCGCMWCGGLRHTPKGRAFLMQYRLEHDGGRVEQLPGRFCSADCRRSYHG